MDKASVKKIPISEKYLLTIKEASEYFNIGENKMYRIVNDFWNPIINLLFKMVVEQ